MTTTVTAAANKKMSERGMTLFAVMAVMSIFAVGLLAEIFQLIERQVRHDYSSLIN